MACGRSIGGASQGLCPQCSYDIPLTNYWLTEENPVKEHFAGLTPIEHASAYFFYIDNSPWRRLIHRFKYSGEWHIAYTLGRSYGRELKASGLYDDIDVVIPIPLHPIKTMLRGYNQSTYIAEGIAKELGIEVDSRSVRRKRNNPSQTKRHARERWENVHGLFAIRRSERLQNRHILLVDDVLTTGATLISCIETIRAAVPNCRISIATLAVTDKISFVK